MRQKILKEPLKTAGVEIYPSEWQELKKILAEENSNLSYFVRSAVQSKLRSHKRKIKCQK